MQFRDNPQMLALHHSHSDSEEVAKTNLSDIIGDVFVVHQISIRDSGVIRWGGNIGLQDHLQWRTMQRRCFDLRS